MYSEREASFKAEDQEVLLGGRGNAFTKNGGWWEIPESERRRQLILEAHRNGHWDVRRTVELVKQDGKVWNRMWENTKDVVDECEICMRHNATKVINRRHTAWHTALFPFSRIHLDTAYIKVTKTLNVILMVAVDSLTKWVEAAFVEDAKASTAALFLMTFIFGRVKEPAVVVTDGGPEFRREF